MTIAGSPANCTTTGLTDGTKCSVCGEILKAQEVIELQGHSYGDWVVVKEATATEKGSEARACGVCGVSETREIPATGEVPSETKPTEPESKPTTPTKQPTQPTQGGNNEGNNTVLIVAVIALFVAAAAIIVLLILKKK